MTEYLLWVDRGVISMVSKRIVILIPPSEGKASGGVGKPLKPSSAAKKMIKALQDHKKDQAKLLGVKGTALQRAIVVNRQLLSSKTLPAIERYTGVVYKGFDYESMGAKAKSFADKHVKIISALFGLVSLQDPLPDYKLKIDKLRAAEYWHPLITDLLKGAFVIDLLPQAHRKALSYNKGIEVEFVIIKDGAKRPAGHAGKHIKGRFVRWICEHQITDPKRFAEFKEEGFKWDGDQFVYTLS